MPLPSPRLLPLLPALLAAPVACTCGGGGPGDVRALGEEQQGVATFYDATGEGACSYARSGDLMVAAMNAAQYAGSAACGACVEVTGPRGTVRVRIVDLCPGCASGHLDLSREAFRQLAEEREGRVAVRWRQVSCPVEGPLRYRFKEGSSQWWTGVQVRNHRLPVTKLEHLREGAWVAVPRTDYNYFVESRGMGSGPVRLRVTASDGQVLEDTLPGVQDAAELSGAAQFR